MVDQRFRFLFVNLPPMMDYRFLGIVKPILFRRAAANAPEHHLLILADHVDDSQHVYVLVD